MFLLIMMEVGKKVLNNINLSFQKGEFIAIVGSSGSGKTTILDLLTNLLQPSEGKIMIDEYLLSDLTTQSLVKNIGYVGQDPFFLVEQFERIYFLAEIIFSDKDIYKALDKANIIDVVNSLPGGLNFKLSDDGFKVSGGQRQRLSLARTLLGEPKILLLDESTSNLDENSEERIIDTIYSLIKNEKLTVIFVTHRISAIEKANRIFRIDNGIIKERKN